LVNNLTLRSENDENQQEDVTLIRAASRVMRITGAKVIYSAPHTLPWQDDSRVNRGAAGCCRGASSPHSTLEFVSGNKTDLSRKPLDKLAEFFGTR